jgi:2-desacetyl-2-hydroxyethyl bacteriochlorophyllide A dehydrogenase
MTCEAVFFEAPFAVGVRSEFVDAPGAGEVGVRAALSAVSAGTELLFYRGQVRPGEPVDAALPALIGPMHYPVRYGYAVVGRVESLGPGVDLQWRGRRVFCFHPHADRFTAPVQGLVPIPDAVEDADAVFLANMETAVTLVLDGTPRIGESVAVFGQGVVGLLTTALLARFPLSRLTAIDPVEFRRNASEQLGATAALAPDGAWGSHLPPDLLYELSGEPETLNATIDLAGVGARIVVGSWYGTKTAPVELGGRFHRSRLRLISSQVSTLPPGLGPAWDRTRRLTLAWDMIRATRPSRLITHRFPLRRAPEAYALLHAQPAEVLQVVLHYC